MNNQEQDVQHCTIFDVAKYIIKKYNSITTMKLEKLCYYCQSWSLAWDEVPLFEEDFEAWANGPVCPELFKKHRGMFSVDNKLFIDREDFVFTDVQLETIEAVLDSYGDKAPHWLSELTHKEDPWILARQGCHQGEKCDNIISKESIQMYYSSL